MGHPDHHTKGADLSFLQACAHDLAGVTAKIPCYPARLEPHSFKLIDGSLR